MNKAFFALWFSMLKSNNGTAVTVTQDTVNNAMNLLSVSLLHDINSEPRLVMYESYMSVMLLAVKTKSRVIMQRDLSSTFVTEKSI